ncbi:MAG: haloacid dehalogenase [Thermodesulfobacteriota bacterium]|nr:MAG: haloacid dehalogenase [Thermodesulfobacteriota bacterium]
MKKKLLYIFVLLIFTMAGNLHAEDTLPSWNDGATKQSIITFVEEVTDKDSKSYVKSEERIAVFDNDGTLWAEKPIYFQLEFVKDRIKELAPSHPEWKTEQPFKAVLENDNKALAESGYEGLMKLLMATHSGMTQAEFQDIAEQWLDTAKHPRFNRPYNELVYQPMLELLAYLRANGFKTYIVSGGGIEFMRPWTEEVYGIPPEQVVGSSLKTEFEMRDGKPVLVRKGEIQFLDDKEVKPVLINSHIGRRPIAAFGNSDGDLQMLQWTAAGNGPSLMVLVHHTDAKREWAYDKDSHIGRLDKALTQANTDGWTVIDMKEDWKTVFPFQSQ